MIQCNSIPIGNFFDMVSYARMGVAIYWDEAPLGDAEEVGHDSTEDPSIVSHPGMGSQPIKDKHC